MEIFGEKAESKPPLRLGMRTVVEFDAAGFPPVVVCTSQATREAICIEPDNCPTDAYNLWSRE
jgi:galactose mutarotase-like enzyme